MSNNVSGSQVTQTPQANGTQRVTDGLALAVAAPVLLSIAALNSIQAVVKGQPVLRQVRRIDACGRAHWVHQFRFGVCKSTAAALDILSGKLTLCGVPLLTDDENWVTTENCAVATPAGMFSHYQLHKLTGFHCEDENAALKKQLRGGVVNNLKLMAQTLFCKTFFAQQTAGLNRALPIFGLTLTNTTMAEAVEWIVEDTDGQRPKSAFFINAHSINLRYRKPQFRHVLNKADALFADGSGIRLAAQHAGTPLADNVNGTDMLPVLCDRAATGGKSLFLLGAVPGVAEKAAKNLISRHPGLRIAGTQHGYFSDNQQVIENIKQSGADIVLVALGSPVQESWIVDNRDTLPCQAVLAVGGLFDFYSGAIKRAPLWMRQLGLEWIYRLIQEPKGKFTRYVVGTPEFLIRTFLLKTA